jgi:hypothetical protein
MSTQDFEPKSVFSLGTKMAVETDQRGEAPSGNNAHWFQGGRWFDIISDGLPTMYDQQALIFPAGHAGKRSMNQQAPVPGRKWSAGDINAVMTHEFIGQWVYGALGTASHNSVPGTDSALMAASSIEADTQQFALTSQPSDGGAVLQIIHTGISGSGRLRVAGNNTEGNAASETLSWEAEAPSAVLYTRTSFSSVTGIDIQSAQVLGGSIAVNGFQHFVHTLSTGPSNPTFAVERLGDPSAGAASKSFIHPSMAIQTLTIDSPAAVRDGIISISSTWEGDPTATCNAKSLNEASAVRIVPAWVLSLTRDGTTYTRPTNHSLTINTGNRNYRSAAGVQIPQGTFFGGREVTQTFDLILDDETEFNRWRGASKQNLVLTWTSPWILHTGQNSTMVASLTETYLENVSTADDDGMFSYSADGRAVADSVNDVAKFEFTNNIPPTAFGGSTQIGS